MRLALVCFYCLCVFVYVLYFIATMSFAGYFLSVLFCLLSMLISDSRFDLVWFRLSCDHGWIRSGSVNVRKQQQQRYALSGIFDVADPTGTVTIDSPVWVSGWNAPLLKLTKAAINANRDDTHDLHRLVDDLFSQIQERLSSRSGDQQRSRSCSRTLLTTSTEHRVEPHSRLCRNLAFGLEPPSLVIYEHSVL